MTTIENLTSQTNTKTKGILDGWKIKHIESKERNSVYSSFNSEFWSTSRFTIKTMMKLPNFMNVDMNDVVLWILNE